MNNNYCVYIHKNKINGKVYIGQTCQKVKQRWGPNGIHYQTSTHFFHAIQKYGWDNFQHIVVKTGLTLEEANDLEVKLIKKYNSTNSEYGYNILPGGHNYKLSKELRDERLNSSHLRKTAKKVRCKETGQVFGAIADAERWANTSHIADVLSKRRNFAGRNPFSGEKLSWEYVSDDTEITTLCKKKNDTYPKLKCGETEVICINTNQKFSSMREAANWCGLKDTANISRCCRNLRQTAGTHPKTKERLKWKYAN